jgi:ATP-dependent RNA helicase RhlE
MFSATISKQIESLARSFQYKPKRIQLGDQSNPVETVRQCVYEVPNHLKGPMLLELLKFPKFSRVLVFVRMKDGANRLTEFLQDSKVKVAKLHSSRSQEQRLKALQDFKDGRATVLVATDIVARGIDIDGVTHVVNYDFPVNPEDYLHRVGRTGRAEAQGEAISFVPRGDLNLLDHLELFIGERIDRRRLRGFDYQGKGPAPKPGEKPPRQDWRKRTREMAAKKTAKKRPNSGPRPPNKEAQKRRRK